MACKRELTHVAFECPKLGRGVRLALIYMSQCGPRFGGKPLLVGFDCEAADECGVKINDEPTWSRCVNPLCPHKT